MGASASQVPLPSDSDRSQGESAHRCGPYRHRLAGRNRCNPIPYQPCDFPSVEAKDHTIIPTSPTLSWTTALHVTGAEGTLARRANPSLSERPKRGGPAIRRKGITENWRRGKAPGMAVLSRDAVYLDSNGRAAKEVVGLRFAGRTVLRNPLRAGRT